MVDNKTIVMSSILAVVISLGIMVTPSFFDTPKYYCEAESSIMECVGGVANTRCYLNTEKSSWDYCKSSWYLITDDYVIQEEPTEEPTEEPVPQTSVWGQQYICDSEGCEVKE